MIYILVLAGMEGVAAAEAAEVAAAAGVVVVVVGVTRGLWVVDDVGGAGF